MNSSIGSFKVSIEGLAENDKPCRIYTNILDRKDGSYIVRYKLFEKCNSLSISITFSGEHAAGSPYMFSKGILSDDCNCPKGYISEMIDEWECGSIPQQISKDLEYFDDIDWDDMRNKVNISNFVFQEYFIEKICLHYNKS